MGNNRKEKIREIFINDLPRKEGWGSQKGKQVIDWANSIGYKVRFIYDDINGEIEIVGYDNKTRYLSIKYLDKEPFGILIKSLQNCMLGEFLDKCTKEFKIEIRTRYIDDKRDITIIDRKYINKEKNNKNGKITILNEKIYKYKCNKCGYECGEHYKHGKYKGELWITESALLSGVGCSCCNNKITVPHINSIVTKEETHWMIPYFQVSYDEAKLYTKTSNIKVYFRCPDCGKIKDKSTSISNLYYDHSIGCVCSDGQSYPSKIMYNLLKQLNIKFKTEYSPSWCKYLYKNKIRKGKYDFFFENNNIKYIIETDGYFHKNDNNMNNQSTEESKFIDDEKDRLAKEHDIEVIRINCVISDIDYIKNNENGILNSKLIELFDLSKIDWIKCEEYALSNLVKIACEIKRDNPNMTTTEIGKMMGLHQDTIIKYLKRGSKVWKWINYYPKEERFKGSSKSGKMNSKPVEIFKNGNSLGTYNSATELERKSEEDFGVKLLQSAISSVCIGNYTSEQYKGYTFKYI